MPCAPVYREKHASGASLRTEVGEDVVLAELIWIERPPTRALDADEVTELGAEAIAVALVHEARGWTIVRRMQKREHADWLMREPASDGRAALEVSGTAKGSLTARVKEKLEQVAKCLVPHRAVCVVRFQEPRARLVDWR